MNPMMNERNENVLKEETFVLSVKKLFELETMFNPHVKTVHEEKKKNIFEFFSGKLF